MAGCKLNRQITLVVVVMPMRTTYECNRRETGPHQIAAFLDSQSIGVSRKNDDSIRRAWLFRLDEKGTQRRQPRLT